MNAFTKISIKNLDSLPRAAGVYSFFKKNTPLYIGKANNLKERIKNHITQPVFKDTLFIKDTDTIGYIKTESDIDALLLESRLIKSIQPKFNTMWKDGKQYFFVAFTKEKLPHIFLTHQPILPKRDLGNSKSRLGRARQPTELKTTNYKLSTEYIGPFVDGKAIKQVLRLLRHAFPYYVKKTHPRGMCPYCHLGLCPGPNPNIAIYKKNLSQLKLILSGKKTSVLGKLEKEMKTASKNENFETAAILRDKLNSLRRIFSHRTQEIDPVRNLVSWDQKKIALQKLLHTTEHITRMESFDISNIQGQEAVGSQVVFINGEPAKDQYRKYKMHSTGKANDFAMIEELLTRRLSHPEWPYPELMVIDGGKGQLTSAMKALKKSKIPNAPRLRSGQAKCHIYICGLAKKNNELFFPYKKEPVLLRDLPKSLENLFLAIRDEAHRFAITFHRKLHTKRTIWSK